MGQSLRTLKGVGEKTEKLFWKVGIYDTDDLLHYYPRNYDEYETPVDIAELKEGTVQAVSAAVCSGVYVNSVKGRQIISVNIADQSGKFPVVWFNLPYLKKTLRKGSWFVFRGRIVRKQGKLEMEHPEIFTPSAYEEILHHLQPIYGLTAGLSNKTVVKMITQLLESVPMQSEYLPEEFRERYELADINYALRTIHFPPNKEELLVSRKRLVFDEFFLFILSVRKMKEKTEETPNCFPVRETWLTEEIIERLPYSLTGAQLNAWHEIERDLAGRRMMSRLVQGDVGSGKTILAFLAMCLVADNGYQAALMAPTEVLARQHYEGFQKLMEEQNLSFPTVLLTGSDTAREKRLAYAKIASGEALVIIGTHALIQEKVEYANLALVITDEQHRFGVKQREALTTRGNPPNVLVMSATPIPRTLAIILYGDLDISVIDELPKNRLPIKNCVVDTGYRPKAYEFIRKQVAQGRQCYVICPMVEESEAMEAENVIDYCEMLSETLGDSINVSFLHGKMKEKEKDEVMNAFGKNEIQVLVSTTVVEVGIDVPNATVIMIENAERFGLAQLHQLRGRVGRGKYQSYCIFMTASKSKETKERLDILNHSNDGFFIASEDLRLRGPGDLFGIRQSGVLDFKVADVFQDAKLLQNASEEADRLLLDDPKLEFPEHRRLKEHLRIKLDEIMLETTL